MPKPEKVISIQVLAWLNAIAENDLGDESDKVKIFVKA